MLPFCLLNIEYICTQKKANIRLANQICEKSFEFVLECASCIPRRYQCESRTCFHTDFVDYARAYFDPCTRVCGVRAHTSKACSRSLRGTCTESRRPRVESRREEEGESLAFEKQFRGRGSRCLANRKLVVSVVCTKRKKNLVSSLHFLEFVVEWSP